MQVRISTPEQTVFTGEADSLVIEGEKGQLEILPMHASLVTFVRPGPAKVRQAGSTKSFDLGEGVLRIHNDEVVILASRIAS